MSGRPTGWSGATRLTAVAGTVFLAGVAGAAAWEALRPGASYVPGQEVDGVVSQLSREVPKSYSAVRFTDATGQAGIDFRHFAGERTSQLPEDMGSGLAWGDYDRDGYPDLYVVNSGPLGEAGGGSGTRRGGCAALYHNRGDGTFTEVAERAGVRYCGVGMGAAWGDYDGDGRPDLFVSGHGRNALYHNEGGGRFEEVTRAAGIDADAGFSAGVAWGDYDRDGRLDLYVTRYVGFERRRAGEGESVRQYDTQVPASLNPSSFPPRRNLLYHNDGDGTFSEVAERVGVADAQGRSLEAVWADLDGDGWPDLYVANDVSDNVLYRNAGGGRFREVSHSAGVADYRGAMGLAVGDPDADTDLDLFITHWIAQENALYRNLSREYAAGGSGTDGGTRSGPAAASPGDGAARMLFADVASSVGLGQSALDYVGWGTFFFDYDNDGRLDLFVVNGSTLQRQDDPRRLVPMGDQLFWNADGREGFYDVSPVAGPYFREERVGRGAAAADYDRDGDVDLAVLNHGGRLRLLRNDGGSSGNWLQLRLRGRESNRAAVGARVRLHAGERVQLREVGAQGSYLSQSTRVQHFGLGSAERVDSLVVRWPSGRVQRLADLSVNRRIVVTEGEATAGKASRGSGSPR